MDLEQKRSVEKYSEVEEAKNRVIETANAFKQDIRKALSESATREDRALANKEGKSKETITRTQAIQEQVTAASKVA